MQEKSLEQGSFLKLSDLQKFSKIIFENQDESVLIDNYSENSNFPQKYKTELCKSYSESGKCKYHNKCMFAHGKEELFKRKTCYNYKQKKCESFYRQGYCPYGMRCNFVHDNRKLEDIFNNWSACNLKFSFNESSETEMKSLCSNEKVKNETSIQVKKRERKRLDVFKKLTASTKKEINAKITEEVKDSKSGFSSKKLLTTSCILEKTI